MWRSRLCGKVMEAVRVRFTLLLFLLIWHTIIDQSLIIRRHILRSMSCDLLSFVNWELRWRFVMPSFLPSVWKLLTRISVFVVCILLCQLFVCLDTFQPGLCLSYCAALSFHLRSRLPWAGIRYWYWYQFWILIVLYIDIGFRYWYCYDVLILKIDTLLLLWCVFPPPGELASELDIGFGYLYWFRIFILV